MDTVTATFSIPDWIEQGLKDGNYVRIGGVIRDAQGKQLVAMLREAAPNLTQAASLLSQLGSVASILNLAVSVIGFTIVIKRLGEIEQRLNLMHQDIKQLHHKTDLLNQKVDLNVYANFHAALDSVEYALTMREIEERRYRINSAIDQFIKAQHDYTGYINISLEHHIPLTDEYISSLFLAYIACARCFLELAQIETAHLALKKGAKNLHLCIDKYIKTLLISEPIAITYPSFVGGPPSQLKSPIELNRLAKICQYLDPSLDNGLDEKSILFQAQDKHLVKFILSIPSDPFAAPPFAAPIGLGVGLGVAAAMAVPLLSPVAGLLGLGAAVAVANSNSEGKKTEKPEEIDSQRLLKVVEKIESMIETYHRFEAYQAEIQVIAQLGISFHDWLKLAPSEDKPDGAELMYIIPDKPLDVAFAS